MPLSELKVLTFCSYLTNVDTPWRPEDHNCLKMVKALKGQPFNGFFDARVGGKTRQYNQDNAGDFVKLIPKKLAAIGNEHFGKNFAFVPIPNSAVTSPGHAEFKILKLAKEIAKIAGVKATPCLTFREPQIASHRGGPRDPYHFESAYQIHTPLPQTDIVLIDDVLTSGAHIQGACWRLKAAGANVIGAIAFGRTTKEQELQPLKVVEHTLSLSKGLFGDEITF